MEELNNFIAGLSESALLWVAVAVAAAFVLFLIFDTIRRRRRRHSSALGHSQRRNPFRRALGAYHDITRELERRKQRKDRRR